MDWYINIVGLEDTADDRLMGSFASDFQFLVLLGYKQMQKCVQHSVHLEKSC
jgi:hypothetical protein